ncbi:MAG TPA: hypothetical protein VM266_00705 [Solirubrobacteraceae bacterium]|nr:hypothetical protein [Solirubrobacteraceae bacterium]
MTEEPDHKHADAAGPDDLEVVEGLPVLSSDDDRTAVAPAPSPAPAPIVANRQVAALAATGFVAGAATVAVIHRRRAKVLPRRARKRGKKGRTAIGEVVSSNSFLVDVHLLRRD